MGGGEGHRMTAHFVWFTFLRSEMVHTQSNPLKSNKTINL